MKTKTAGKKIEKVEPKAQAPDFEAKIGQEVPPEPMKKEPVVAKAKAPEKMPEYNRLGRLLDLLMADPGIGLHTKRGIVKLRKELES